MRIRIKYALETILMRFSHMYDIGVLILLVFVAYF